MTIASEVLTERMKLLLALELLQELAELSCEGVALHVARDYWGPQVKARLYDLEHEGGK